MRNSREKLSQTYPKQFPFSHTLIREGVIALHYHYFEEVDKALVTFATLLEEMATKPEDEYEGSLAYRGVFDYINNLQKRNDEIEKKTKELEAAADEYFKF